MSIQLQEISAIFISQNRLVEGKDYEVYNYLKGTGGCYIDTLINPAWDDQLSATTEVSGRPTVHNPYILDATGTNTKIAILLGGGWYEKNITQFLVTTRKSAEDAYFLCKWAPANAEFYASFEVVNNSEPTVIFKVNGEKWTNVITEGSNIITELPNTTYKIGRGTANGLDVLKLKNVNINSHNFVPCQLLKSIPATLDANNIARQAGECGMYDSISGKFYGNVARSGAFTVENLVESGTVEDTRLHQIYRNKLVEGKDYKRAELLNGDGTIRTINDTTNVSTINLKFKINSFVDGRLFGRDNTYRLLCGTYISNSFRSWGNNEVTFTNVGTDVDFTFDIVNRKAILNGVEKSQTYAKKAGAYLLLAPQNRTSIASLSIGNIMSLTPCRLLRPIPRNLDAQCKSRQTGECGMIDLISGRFYGNVSDSGTFSLAWDEWLKDCSIQFDPETTLGYSTSIPNDYVIYGRIEVAKLTAQYTDFGFMQASNNYIVLGESTVYAINDWGTNKWATFVVSYSGGYECSLQLNGVALTTVTQSTPYNQSPHIQLHGIMQLNKIEHTSYPNESDPTQSHSEVWKRFVDQDGRQGLGISDLTYKIYAD